MEKETGASRYCARLQHRHKVAGLSYWKNTSDYMQLGSFFNATSNKITIRASLWCDACSLPYEVVITNPQVTWQQRLKGLSYMLLTPLVAFILFVVIGIDNQLLQFFLIWILACGGLIFSVKGLRMMVFPSAQILEVFTQKAVSSHRAKIAMAD